MRVLTTKKVLVPLATAAMAGALAVGSGATFSSTTGNTASGVTTGSLTQSNSKANAAVFNLTNMKPGDSVSGTVVITNTGSLKAQMSLVEAAVANTTNPFSSAALLQESIQDVTNAAAPVSVYSGTFGAAGTVQLGTWAAAEAHTYKVTVTLDSATTNTDQNKSAAATYTWNGTQESATAYNQ
jgi:hypothetical protein